jgi:tetratricopeptide (TPR) repeat protein
MMDALMMNSVLRRAANLTAEGANFLESSHLDEADEFFTKALDIIVKAENYWLFPQSKDFLLELHGIDEALKRLPQIRPESPENRRRNYANSAFFVYDEPLLFVPETHVTDSYLAFYKAVLLFNIGLVLHRKSNCVDAWSVYRALHFYELCLTCCKDCEDHPSCLEISAAALNNKAHIYFEHCEYSTARMVLDNLLVTMIFTHGRPLEFEEENTQGILFNLYMLRMPTSAQTA